MEIPLLLIRSVKLMPDCHPVCLIFPDAAFPLIFELSFVFKDFSIVDNFRDAEVVGSNPVASMNKEPEIP